MNFLHTIVPLYIVVTVVVADVVMVVVWLVVTDSDMVVLALVVPVELPELVPLEEPDVVTDDVCVDVSDTEALDEPVVLAVEVAVVVGLDSWQSCRDPMTCDEVAWLIRETRTLHASLSRMYPATHFIVLGPLPVLPNDDAA